MPEAHSSEQENADLIRRLSRVLLCRKGSEWVPIPPWARSFMIIGGGTASIYQAPGRSVVAFILPTRAYATPLLAAGIVVERARMLAQRVRSQKRFDGLWSLPDGNGVYIFQGSLRFKGIIKSHETDGCRRLRIQIDRNRNGGGTEYIIKPDQAHHLQPADRNFNLPRCQKGDKIDPPELLGAVLEHANLVPGQWYSSLECLIVGKAGLIEEEAKLPIALGSLTGRQLEGRLSDLVLPRRVEGEKAIYRSDILPMSIDEEELPLLTHDTLVVMNGAAAFIEKAHHWPDHDLIILLSPQDPSFTDAVEKLNGWYRRSEGSFELPQLSALPERIEAMTFLERRSDD